MAGFRFKPKAAAAVLVIVAAVLAIVLLRGGMRLILEDTTTGEIYAELPIELGERFSVTFTHSVNRSPLTDVYELREDGIYVVETKYYGFGAGVQTEIEEGQTLTYTEDGAMLVSGFEQRMDNLIYSVGTAGHTLVLGEDSLDLAGLCGRNSSVRFYCKWRC